ncbi:hypothetical protein HELRODRAFT_165176 [Helobdella robusta]|uniref:Uncharacterized protein n=1 Tax=Helobdella robusta TaxID=6412 RepID=T1EWD8_HELRO|nr:hypothetical protein HELRODRAFT_165176 [Helobdella robusta]ESN93021.1 hypothetical protein HELRODRAFT_165176 [Helobdella robusta]
MQGMIQDTGKETNRKETNRQTDKQKTDGFYSREAKEKMCQFSVIYVQLMRTSRLQPNLVNLVIISCCVQSRTPLQTPEGSFPAEGQHRQPQHRLCKCEFNMLLIFNRTTERMMNE